MFMWCGNDEPTIELTMPMLIASLGLTVDPVGAYRPLPVSDDLDVLVTVSHRTSRRVATALLIARFVMCVKGSRHPAAGSPTTREKAP